MKKQILQFGFIGLVVSGLLTACYKEDLDKFQNADMANLTPEWSIPLTVSKMDLSSDIATGSLTTILVSDTAGADLVEKPDELEWVRFHLKTRNRYPFTASLQFYFLDANNVRIDSAFTSLPLPTLTAATLDGSGNVVTEGVDFNSTGLFDNARLVNLASTAKVNFVMVLNAPNTGSTFSTYSDSTKYYIEQGLAIDTKLNVKL